MKVTIEYSNGTSTIIQECKYQEIDREQSYLDFKNEVIEVLYCAIESEQNKFNTK